MFAEHVDTDGWTGESRDGQPLPVEFSDSEELIYITPSTEFSDDVAYMVAPGRTTIRVIVVLSNVCFVFCSVVDT